MPYLDPMGKTYSPTQIKANLFGESVSLTAPPHVRGNWPRCRLVVVIVGPNLCNTRDLQKTPIYGCFQK